MRFYLATASTQADLADAVADALIASGLTQAYRWTDTVRAYGSPERPDKRLLQGVALDELHHVGEADVLVVLEPAGYGTHVEIGAALASRVPVVLVGASFANHNPFYYHPLVTWVADAPADLDVPGTLVPLLRFLLSPAFDPRKVPA